MLPLSAPRSNNLFKESNDMDVSIPLKASYLSLEKVKGSLASTAE